MGTDTKSPEHRSAIKIGLKAFIVSAGIILLLMIFSGVLTVLLPSGMYGRVVHDGRTLGWDSLTGLGMSLLPLAFGFASVTNPFTIAVAQKIADLPLFSGAWLRLIFFATVYGVVTAFVIHHTRKVEENPLRSPTFALDEEIRKRFPTPPNSMEETSALMEVSSMTSGIAGPQQKGRALVWFALCVAVAMVVVFATARSATLSDLAFSIMGILLSPLADLVGISRQTAVLAFDFGDGFSNMIFPTNALLLIALSFTVVSYPKWMAFTWKLQLIILALTSAFLALAVAIHFGPF